MQNKEDWRFIGDSTFYQVSTFWQCKITHSYSKLGRIGAMTGVFGADNKMSKKVHCTTLDITFGGCREAARQLGLHATRLWHNFKQN